jgi:pimeloyl-ACP methyl ester carboxylesterase
MKQVPLALSASLAAASRVSPAVAAELAFPLFVSTGRPARVRDHERATHESARSQHLTVDGKSVQIYTWGNGASVVLLVHGWGSRGSRFATLVRDLRAEGRTVVSFDAPGHGESGGRRTHALEYARVIAALQARFGGFDAVVGHSFGLLAILVALERGVTTRSVIGIAGVSRGDSLFELFGSVAGLSPEARSRLITVFARRVLRHTDMEAPVGGAPLSRFNFTRRPLEVPLLLVHDPADAETSVEQSRLLHAANQGQTGGAHAELAEFAKLGHSRILDDGAVLDRVLAFIDRHSAAPQHPEAIDGSATRPVETHSP